MDKHLTFRVSRRGIKMAFILAVVVTVLAPIAVIAAGGTFTDDDTSIFEADIEWMAANGVTAGCNPPANDHYCPDDAVTRGQMAAFMRRLATNNIVNAATAVTADDAGTLDGMDPTHYDNPAYGTACIGSNCTDTTGSMNMVAILELTVTAPEAGFLTIASSYAGHSTDAGGYTQTWVTMDTATDCGGWFGGPFENVPGSWTVATVDTDIDFTSDSATALTEVTAGSHTLKLCALGLAAINTQQASLVATFTTRGTADVITATVDATDYSLFIDGYEGVKAVD